MGFYLSYRLWSTYDPDLIKLFHAIYLDDIEQVQTCLEQNHVKCHPLCDCDLCSTGDKLLMSKDDLRFWTPLSLACWLGEYKNNYIICSPQCMLQYPNKILNTSIENILKYHYQYGFSNNTGPVSVFYRNT